MGIFLIMLGIHFICKLSPYFFASHVQVHLYSTQKAGVPTRYRIRGTGNDGITVTTTKVTVVPSDFQECFPAENVDAEGRR